MKKATRINILTILVLLVLTLPIAAAKIEGEISHTNTSARTLTLVKENGQKVTLKVATNAKLYYNNAEANLNMYNPITDSDFVSGYVETDAKGIVQTAHFYYMIREGVIEELANGKLVLLETESSITDTYTVSSNAQVFLNNYPAELNNLSTGMKALVILDYKYRVKKLAVFHYQYTGFIETIDLKQQKVVMNVGSRLHPDRREFAIGGKVRGLCDTWEALAVMMETKPLIYAKVLIDQGRNAIYLADLRSL